MYFRIYMIRMAGQNNTLFPMFIEVGKYFGTFLSDISVKTLKLLKTRGHRRIKFTLGKICKKRQNKTKNRSFWFYQGFKSSTLNKDKTQSRVHILSISRSMA